MPSAKTECTELSVAFGILGIENILDLNQSQVETYFTGTLTSKKYARFIKEFPCNEVLYRKMYNVGFGLRAVYVPYKTVNSLIWAGPQQQAATTSAAIDLLVANIPVSVKATSDNVHSPSPYNLFKTIPGGQLKARVWENWYLEQAPLEYQELYSYVRNKKGLEYLPENVEEFERSIKGKQRKVIKKVIASFSDDEKQTLKQLYLRMCHKVAKLSADIFNKNFKISMQGHSKNAVLEQITRDFFRLDTVEYILGGLDNKKAFAVTVPDLTRWKQDWVITDVIAEPELEREQSRVRFSIHYKNKKSRENYIAEFHVQIRWSHGKFQTKPEAKLYKNFSWKEVPFFESVYGSEPITRLRIIGDGTSGTVYGALHHSTGMQVAVKELKTNIFTTLDERKRFEREIKIISTLKHPNILPVIDYELSASCSWFAMPLAKTNIANIVDELKHDLRRVNFFYHQILTGVKYAHKQNIIHRDLKPQNILVFENDLVKIGDFGLGKDLGEDASIMALTGTDDNLGTFAYMAPEQLISAATVDYRADIYSLGKTLLHMIVGGILPVFPDQIIHLVDKRYVSFIERCIQERPEDRFQSVDGMIESFSVLTSEF